VARGRGREGCGWRRRSFNRFKWASRARRSGYAGIDSGFYKGKLDDDGFAERAFGGDVYDGSDVEVGTFQIAEAEGGARQDGGDRAGSDAADLVVGIVKDLCAGDGEGIGLHAQADEFLGDLLAGVHAGDDFLTGIAALGEGDGAGEQIAGFGGEDRVVEVDAEQGTARFDARGVEGGPADGTQGTLAEGVGLGEAIEEGGPDARGVCGGEDEVAAGRAGGVVAIERGLSFKEVYRSALMRLQLHGGDAHATQ